MNIIVKYFVRGLIVFVPVTATIWLFYVVFLRLDGWLGIKVPGLGFLVTVAAITLIGFLASHFVTRTAIEAFENFLARLPLVKLVYSSMRDLTNAFVGEKRSFDRPVSVSLGGGLDARVIGFVTRESLGMLGLPGHVVVYVPQAYAIAGHTLLVPKERVSPIDLPSALVMAFIVSGGVAGLAPDVPQLPERAKSM